jgi:hypothetical protein
MLVILLGTDVYDRLRMKKNNFKYIVLVVWLAVGSWPKLAEGQYRDGFDTDVWLYGKIVLSTGDSLTGALVYHPSKDVVQIASDNGKISSFSPVNVNYFEVNGVYRGKTQLFRTLYWNQGNHQNDFKMPVFFEQVCSGKMVLIKRYTDIAPARADKAVKDSPHHYAYPHFISMSEELKEDYFVLLPDNNILPIRNRKRDLLRLFGSHSGQVKQYVRENKLDYNDPTHIVTIVDYYNSL